MQVFFQVIGLLKGKMSKKSYPIFIVDAFSSEAFGESFFFFLPETCLYSLAHCGGYFLANSDNACV